jgi:hypothetical protein
MKTVYQYDRSGLYVGETVADESPLEPGVWLMPALTVDVPPPTEFQKEQWPRWNGAAWVLANNITAANDNDPLKKLQAFLHANPDVAELLNNQGGV